MQLSGSLCGKRVSSGLQPRAWPSTGSSIARRKTPLRVAKDVEKEVATLQPSPTSVEVSTGDAPLAVPRPPQVAFEDVILFQAFGWQSSKQNGAWYEKIKESLQDLKNSGATHVWLPPPSKSVSREGYLPTQL